MSLSSLKLSFSLLVLSLTTVVGATPSARADDAYSDDRYEFKVAVPEPWAKAAVTGYTVPGTARAAWSGKDNASIVAFVQSPGQAFSPRFLVDASAKSVEDKLGAKILEKEVKPVSGKQAMWLSYEGKGTGGAVTGQGDVLTTQHWVAVPRETDVIILLLTCPSADYKTAKKSFETAVKSLEINGKQTKEQSEAK
jgi:hypothetical protein